ncbi:signal-transducing adaptor protein 2a isoform X1 [Kryptolebias marmoratus]|uniref:signal-transducing adaptor protein 2a isoform X1 n=1 Tax=Kryptolebias marmoratus TaxID=37003 RepID=UPI0018ACF4D5|nr:signal-transducing adaptor protein 2a isoform X1 [Kryptolebias marmoratus]
MTATALSHREKACQSPGSVSLSLSLPLSSLGARAATLMAAVVPVRQRCGSLSPRAQLPPCYYEGYLEKRGPKEKASRRLWTCLCGNSLYFFNNAKDTHYMEKLDLGGFVSLKDDSSRDKNLEAARLILRMKDGETKLTVRPSACPPARSHLNIEHVREDLTANLLCRVPSQLNVPSCLTLLPGQLQMLKEVVDKERSRRRARNPARAPPSPLSVPLVGEIPPCFRPVSRTEAEVLLERHPDCGNMLLRPGRDGCSLAVTTRQDLNGSVFRHYRVTQRDQGGYVIDVENPIPCATLHEVIDALVERTAGTLQPFLLEEPYEENITYVSANDENGERILHTAPTSPLPKAPALPPKQDRWCSSPLSRSPVADRRSRTSSPVPASPTNPMKRLVLSPSPLSQTLNEELKMTLEKRRASQE